MKLGISSVLPRKAIEALKGSVAISSTRQLTDAAASEPDVLLAGMGCSRTGLREEEAERRLEQHGPNAVASEQGHGRLGLLGKAVVNPLVGLILRASQLRSIGTGHRADLPPARPRAIVRRGVT